MRKKILSLALLLSFAIPSLAFSKISIPDSDDEYYDIDVDEETTAGNFFLEDANDHDFEISFDADSPDIKPCNGIVTSNFGWRRISRRRGRLHKGVDIAAPVGTPVTAPADGRVAFVGRKGGYGNTVIIDHGGNLTTLYGHNGDIMVNEGEMVRKGQQISSIGMSGRSTGPHVHYEVRVDGSPVNPSRFF